MTEKPESISNKLNYTIVNICLFFTGGLLYRKFKKKSYHAMDYQKKILNKIITNNKNTQFGKDHKFSEIKSISDFQKNVPVQTWDSLSPYMDQHINGGENLLIPGKPFAYAATSGTTGKPKYIPLTREIMKKGQINNSRIFSYKVSKDFPGVFKGKILAIVSPVEEGRVPDGTPYGSTSGLLLKELTSGLKLKALNRLFQKKYSVPHEVFSIEDYNSKYYTILRCSIDQNITMIGSANPSTIVLLAHKANEWKERLINDIRFGTLCSKAEMNHTIRQIVEKRLKPMPELADRLEQLIKNNPDNSLLPEHYWPNLILAGCWTGGNSYVFIQEMQTLYKNIAIRDIGYLASEIRGSIPLSKKDNSGVMTFDQNFFEFIHVDKINDNPPEFLTIDQLKKGEQYYIYITTAAGLYRYHINDIIEIAGFSNTVPTMKFVQKGSGVTSITGEKLYEQQLIDAVENTKSKLEIETKFYMCLANVKRKLYELYIDFANPEIDDQDKYLFMNLLDENLKKNNIEYKSKRDSLRLDHIELCELETGAYEKFKLQKISEGCREAQFKTVLLTQDDKIIKEFKIKATYRNDLKAAS